MLHDLCNDERIRKIKNNINSLFIISDMIYQKLYTDLLVYDTVESCKAKWDKCTVIILCIKYILFLFPSIYLSVYVYRITKKRWESILMEFS